MAPEFIVSGADLDPTVENMGLGNTSLRQLTTSLGDGFSVFVALGIEKVE